MFSLELLSKIAVGRGKKKKKCYDAFVSKRQPSRRV